MLEGPVFIGQELAHVRVVAWVVCSPALPLATLKSLMLKNACTVSYGTGFISEIKQHLHKQIMVTLYSPVGVFPFW